MKSVLVEAAADRHAIEVFAIGLEWAEPLAKETIESLDHAAISDPTFSTLLPHRTRLQQLQVHLSIDVESIKVEEPTEIGWNYADAVQGQQPTWSVALQPTLVTCNCRSYDRWLSVKQRSTELLSPLVGAAQQLSIDLGGIGVQYEDWFRIKQASAKEAIEAVANLASPLLPPQQKVLESLWHVHQGWFSESALGNRIHNVVNVDINQEEDGSFVFKISGQHKFLAFSMDRKNMLGISYDAISVILDELHQINKTVLRDLLSNRARQMISLDGEQR